MNGPHQTGRFDRSLLSAPRFAGRVESRFETAVVARPEGEGARLVLVAFDRDLVPRGVALPLDAVRAERGAPVLLEGRSLELGGFLAELAGEGVALVVPRAPFSDRRFAEQLGTTALGVRARSLLASGTRPGRDEDRGVDFAAVRLNRLVAHLCSPFATAADFTELVARLSGLGPGSTPTGDDLIAGVAAAGFRLAQTGRMHPGNWKAFLEAIRVLRRDATTPTAREMLDHAVEGSFPESLLRFVNVMGDERADPRDFKAAADRLETLGSRTGSDMIAGAVALVLAVRSCSGGIA